MIKSISEYSLHRLFENRVKLNPDNTAVIYGNQSITYQELNNSADKLAGYILQKWKDTTNNKKNPNKLIAIFLDPDIEIVISILAVLKAGLSYIPLDPDNPEPRLKYMIENSQPSLLITSKIIGKKFNFLKFLKKIGANTIFLDEVHKKKNNATTSSVVKNNLAYIIYTSGSTGNPKGVMINHDSVINTILDVNKKFCVNQNDRILMLSSPSFDLSVYDIFGSFAAGATVVIPNINLRRDPVHWLELILNRNITIWNSVPSLAQILVDYIEENNNNSTINLRLFLLSGDWISLNLPKQLRKNFKNIKIISLGGATEASIWSVYYPIGEIFTFWKSIPYGKALSSQTVHILREDLQPVISDEVGMIYIGGVGLAQGYLNDKEKTEKSFIKHPYTQEKLYKTGDYGQYLEDGNIEFLGRQDEQVKIGGYRIELGEIEHIVNLHTQVKECIVLKKENQLVVYYVQSKVTEGSGNLLKKSLDNHIISWKELYDDVYASSNRNNIKKFDTSGWISSYTNKSFPKYEMLEWVERTVERILSFNAENILEIGCGTGLLLFRIANFCKKYTGMDISSVIIDKLKKNLNELNLYKNVEVLHGEAASFIDNPLLKNKKFDLIIMNSVVQYFPNLQYLENIINKSIDILNNEGKIFIGDIRDYRLRVPFVISKILNKKENISNIESVIYKECFLEKELLISPEYFINLKNKNSAISKLELLPKRGKYLNEMNCYRYDVVLHINHNEIIKKKKTKINWITWNKNLSLQELLLQGKRIVAIQNYPNKRIWAIFNISNFSVADEIFDGKKHKKFIQEENNLYDLELLYELANKYNYCLHVNLSTGSKNSSAMYDLLFLKKECNEDIIDHHNYGDNKFNELMSNKQFSVLSSMVLKDYVAKYLPSYMIPTHYILLEKLPLTPNGKIDKNLLLTLFDFELHSEKYIQPSTPIEKDLISIWGKTLNIDFSKISINDNFFNLGGHSISAILIIAHIRSIHKIKLKVSDIYNYPTIQQLAKFIESECVTKGNNNLQEIVDYTNDKNTAQTFPLSYVQLFFWFLKSGKCKTCNIVTRVRFVGNLDINYLHKAVNKLLRKYKIFWYSILTKRPAQIFVEPFTFSIPIIDKTNLIIEEQEEFLKQNYIKLRDSDFDFNIVPLVKIELIHLNEGMYELQICLPHIIGDAVTADNIIEELKMCYQSQENIDSCNIIQYVDYARNERNLVRNNIRSYISFWREYTKFGTLFYLPGEFFEQTELIKPFNLPYITLTEKNIKKLNTLCKKRNATMAMGFLTVVCMTLCKFAKQDNIFITVIRSNRSEEIFSKAIGPFVNSDLIKINIKENNFLKILKSVKYSLSEVEQHWDCPEIIKFGCAAENNLKFSHFSLKMINLISYLLTKLFFRIDLADNILSMYSRLISPIPHSLKNKILRLWNLLRFKKNTKCSPQGVEIMFNLLPSFFELDVREDYWLDDLKISFPIIEEEKAFPSNYNREERFTNDNFLIFTISKVEGSQRLYIEGPCNNWGSSKILQIFHDTIEKLT